MDGVWVHYRSFWSINKNKPLPVAIAKQQISLTVASKELQYTLFLFSRLEVSLL